MVARTATVACFTAALLLTLAGCSGRDQIGTVPASGKILLDGQPLAGANVRFFPDEGPVASGYTNDSGEFVLSTNAENPGVLMGKHQVTVQKLSPVDPQDPYAPPQNLVPAKYGSAKTSGLTETISEGGKTDIVLELKSSND